MSIVHSWDTLRSAEVGWGMLPAQTPWSPRPGEIHVTPSLNQMLYTGSISFHLIVFILYWSAVDLECWVSLRCEAKWFRYTYIYISILFPYRTLVGFCVYVYLFVLSIFYWRIIALQNFAVFCQTSTWISHRYTYLPSLLNLPPIPLPTPPL